MVICLERGADLHMAQLMPQRLTVSCFSKIQIGFTFLFVCVCVTCVLVNSFLTVNCLGTISLLVVCCIFLSLPVLCLFCAGSCCDIARRVDVGYRVAFVTCCC